MGTGKATTCVLLAMTFFSTGRVLGNGLVVPGPETERNFYYAVSNGNLYRFVCPEGEVASADNCVQTDTGFPIRYSNVRDALENDIKTALFEVAGKIKTETKNLREADPRVQAFRKVVKDSLDQISAHQERCATLDHETSRHAKNLGAVTKELGSIGKRLSGDLSQEEIGRLVEVRIARLKDQARFQKALDTAASEAQAIRAQIAVLDNTIATKTTEVGQLLPTLPVTSNTLNTLTAQKEALSAEMELLPELDKRLNDPIAYPLNVWVESATPGVPEFVQRFQGRATAFARVPGATIHQPGEVVAPRKKCH